MSRYRFEPLDFSGISTYPLESRPSKVTADDLPAYVERVVSRFAAERAEGERFAQWVARAAEEALR